MNTQISVTRWVNRIIGVLVGVMIFLLPRTLDFFNLFRPMVDAARWALMGAYYCCVIPVGLALYAIELLLRNIGAGQVFTYGNVRLISRIRWCCLGVSLICLPAAFLYPSLIFLSIIMGFLTLIVSVVVNVIAAAVEIREENDLTV